MTMQADDQRARRALAILRPEPGNAATAAAVVARGHRAVRLPLFAVRPVAWEPPAASRYDALLLTSANAVRNGGPGLDALKALPVHAVGAATAMAARDAGFVVASVGEAGVDAIAVPRRTLHLAGRDHRRRAGVDVAIVYASDPLDADVSVLAGTVALLHSPRAAARLAELVERRADVAIAAISPAAATAAGPGWRALAMAASPTDGALIDAAIALAD